MGMRFETGCKCCQVEIVGLHIDKYRCDLNDQGIDGQYN